MRLERTPWRLIGSLAGLMLLFAGPIACDDKEEGTGGGTGSTATAAKSARAGAKVELPEVGLEPSADVIVYGGTNTLDDLMGKVQGLAGKVVPQTPPLQQMIGPALQGELRLKSAEPIDVKKPLRFALFDPKKYPKDPTAVMFGITGRDKLEAALPDNKKADDQGNAFSYVKFEGSTRPVFLNFIGDFVVVTREPTLFGQNKDFLEKLTQAEMPRAGGVVVAMKNINRIFGAEMKQGLSEVRANVSQMAEQMPNLQADSIVTMIDWVTSAIAELEEIRVVGTLFDDGAKAEIILQPAKGSQLAKTFEALSGRGDTALLARLPADSPFFALASFDPAKMEPLATSMMTMMVGAAFGGDEAKAKTYRDAFMEYMKALTGDFVIAAHGGSAGQGLSLVALGGVKDAAKARETYRALAGMYQEPTVVEHYKKLGLQMEVKQGAYEVDGVKVDVISSKLANLPTDMGPVGGMMGMLNELMTQHVAIGKDLTVIAYGSDGRKQVESFLGGKVQGGLKDAKGVARALKHMAANANFLMYVSPVDLARELKLGGMNPLAPALAGIDAETGVAFSAGTTDGVMQIVIDVPVETVQKAYQGFEKSKGAF